MLAWEIHPRQKQECEQRLGDDGLGMRAFDNSCCSFCSVLRLANTWKTGDKSGGFLWSFSFYPPFLYLSLYWTIVSYSYKTLIQIPYIESLFILNKLALVSQMMVANTDLNLNEFTELQRNHSDWSVENIRPGRKGQVSSIADFTNK